jgi:hypothetical protein
MAGRSKRLILNLSGGSGVEHTDSISDRGGYRNIFRIWAARTRTGWDDFMVRSTTIASFLWCLWLSIYLGLITSQWVIRLPQNWQDILNSIIPGIFVTLVIYTAIMLVIGTLSWYKTEICSKTKSNLDNIIMSVLIKGTLPAGFFVPELEKYILRKLGKKKNPT